MQSGIYLILNKINGKGYVGQTVNIRKRWNKHKSNLRRKIHPNSYLQNAWNKYGEENFGFLVLEYTNKNILLIAEDFWINFLDTKNNGYNLLSGGQKTPIMVGKNNPMYGKRHSEETRQKIKKNHAPMNGQLNSNSKYNLWDIKVCHYNKGAFFRGTNKNGLNPRKCFIMAYNGKHLNIGYFLDFISIEIINQIIRDETND